MAFLVVPLLVLLGLAAVLAMWGIGVYNGLVAARNRVKESWAQVDVQLKRRFDLIPNLMETVKGYMQHERATLAAVTAARAAVAGAGTQAQRVEAEAGLTGALGRLFAVSEAYPDLKASANFASLQEELASTENKIGFARQFYNETVMNLNNKVQMFPGNIIAGMFRFGTETFFEVKDEAQREAPKVSFN